MLTASLPIIGHGAGAPPVWLVVLTLVGAFANFRLVVNPSPVRLPRGELLLWLGAVIAYFAALFAVLFSVPAEPMRWPQSLTIGLGALLGFAAFFALTRRATQRRD
jgi:hypothetical protein